MESLDKLNKRLQENAQSLHINRVPLRIKREFKAWADAEFSGEDGKGDYGFALKWLWEERLDAITLNARIEELEARIAKIELAPKQEEKPKARRMIGGNTIPLRR